MRKHSHLDFATLAHSTVQSIVQDEWAGCFLLWFIYKW